MHVIITGGTGLIGRALAASLAADHHAVTALSRSPETARPFPPGVQVVGWDGKTAQGWGHLADGADAIVNLAGTGIADARWTDARKAEIKESRVNAGTAVVAAIAAAASKPKVLIQSSAVGFYGPHGDEAVAEGSAAGADFLAEVCKAWEASTAPVEAMGVRRCVIRTGVVLAVDGGALPKMVMPFRLFVGGPVGSGKQFLPWIHLADEVAAIRFLIQDEGASGAFNLSAPNPVTNAEFGRTIGKVLGRPAFAPAPAFVMRLVFGEMATVLLDGQRAVPERLQGAGFTWQYPEAEGALRALLGSG